jgi:hypothetical protein
MSTLRDDIDDPFLTPEQAGEILHVTTGTPSAAHFHVAVPT